MLAQLLRLAGTASVETIRCACSGEGQVVNGKFGGCAHLVSLKAHPLTARFVRVRVDQVLRRGLKGQTMAGRKN